MCTVVINLSAVYRSIINKIEAKQWSSGANTEMITGIENITILL